MPTGTSPFQWAEGRTALSSFTPLVVNVWAVRRPEHSLGLAGVLPFGPTAMLWTFTTFVTFYDLYVGLLKAAIAAAVSLSVLISLDRLYRVLKYARISFRSWLTGQKPEHEFGARPLPDPTHFSLAYPRVAVQLPMFNERAVCQAAIDSAAELAWPRNRFCVQVPSHTLASIDLSYLTGSSCGQPRQDLLARPLVDVRQPDGL